MPTVAPLDIEDHILKVCFLNDIPFYAGASGDVHWLDHGHKQANIHDGLLCATPNLSQTSLITGGEDGKIMRVSSSGTSELIAHHPRKWVHAIASGPQETIGYAIGKQAHVHFATGKTTCLEHNRTAEGLAFAPKGIRLGVAHYNGASLHFPATQGKPLELEWAGAHHAITFSPNNKYCVSSMQENALHGWHLGDGRHMRMEGYPAKVKSVSWSANGKWLASSGAPAAIVWPFSGKDGPMGKAPLELGTRGNILVTCVACHPSSEMVAIGYNDGMILGVLFEGSKEVVLRREGKGAITSMAWDNAGIRLAFGSQAGDCGLVDLR